jgi:hypothetical protein
LPSAIRDSANPRVSKRIPRKLRAENRGAAISQYLRLTIGEH